KLSRAPLARGAVTRQKLLDECFWRKFACDGHYEFAARSRHYVTPARRHNPRKLPRALDVHGVAGCRLLQVPEGTHAFWGVGGRDRLGLDRYGRARHWHDEDGDGESMA